MTKAVLQWLVRIVLAYIFLQAIAVVAVGIGVTVEGIESGRVVLSAPCPVLSKTGSPCPTCGMTRGVAAFFHGRFRKAFAFNRWAAPIALLETLIVLCGASYVGSAVSSRIRSTRRTDQPAQT
jgi:hypothetical protein